jgi:hypothetical protein
MKYLAYIKAKLVPALLFVPLLACQKNDMDNLFGKSPNQRIETARTDLYKELMAAKDGWKFDYYPRLLDGSNDSVKFTYLFKFIDSTRVVMKASNHIGIQDTSEYDVALGSTIKLRFTTYNFIHELADAANSNKYKTGGRGAAGEFEFLYYGKEGSDLSFKTNREQKDIRLVPATSESWNEAE